MIKLGVQTISWQGLSPRASEMLTNELAQSVLPNFLEQEFCLVWCQWDRGIKISREGLLPLTLFTNGML